MNVFYTHITELLVKSVAILVMTVLGLDIFFAVTVFASSPLSSSHLDLMLHAVASFVSFSPLPMLCLMYLFMLAFSASIHIIL